ncbi:MAG: serine/threonine-protein kinase [Limisphaerales bacterium]
MLNPGERGILSPCKTAKSVGKREAGFDRQTRQRAALKVPLTQFETDRNYLLRFQREEMIGVTLDHPNLLRFVWVKHKKCRPYIVTEYLEGETLAMRLLKETPIPEAEAVRIASQVCAGLDYLHGKGVVHRGLKPDNIMLCKDGVARIIDFGIANSGYARRLTFGPGSARLGTPGYLSPEQAQGKRGDVPSDIYALGAMLYEMTTGVPPHHSAHPLLVLNARLNSDPVAPRKLNPALSRELDKIILYALEREPCKRFSTAAAMKADLDCIAAAKLN